jgi:glycerophosphoryl diester phosphodiesterase
MTRTLFVIALASLCVVARGSAATDDFRDGPGSHDRRSPRPLVIGHRGATGYLPEHTLASYELAILRGADYIEPDLVSTKDGVLIARHEVNITETTDVANRPEFKNRFTTKTIDGNKEQGWFADDFTLAEIKTLRAKQRLGFRPQEFNTFYRVPTFNEVIELAQLWSFRTGRAIGVYPETKHPTYHKSVGLPLEEKLVKALERHGWNSRRAPVFIQSFEVGNLKKLNTMTSVRLVQLVDALDTALDGSIIPYQPYDFVVSGDPRTYADLVTPAGLAEIATYADGVGPWKRYIVSVAGVDQDQNGEADDVNGDGVVDDSDKTALPPTSLIADAHAVGLIVHTWTFRNERRYLARDYGDSPSEEYLQFFCLGIDGLFSDFPDTAVSARDLLGLAPRVCDAK